MSRRAAGPVMTEADLLRFVRATARAFGWLAFHNRYAVGSDPGFPDVLLARGHRLVAAELKGPHGSLRPGQLAWLAAFTRSGNEGYLWWSNEPSIRDTVVHVLSAETRPEDAPGLVSEVEEVP